MNWPKRHRIKGPRIAAVPAILVLLLSVAPPAASQEVRLGARAGISVTWLSGYVDTDTRTGFAAGAFASASLTDWLAVVPELAFVRKGGKTVIVAYVTDPTTGNPVERSITETTAIDYIQLSLPGAVTISLSRSRATIARFYVGPFYGLQASCDFTHELESTEIPTSGTDDCSAWLKNFDFGLVLGGGIDLGIGQGALTGDVRFELGLPEIAEGERSLKSRALLLLVGYSHRLGGR